jgi:hypothetical protein
MRFLLLISLLCFCGVARSQHVTPLRHKAGSSGPLTPCFYPAYDPKTQTNLFIELLADDPTSLTNTVNASSITNWFDLSGKNYTFTNPGSPLGLPVVRTTGYTPTGCSTVDFGWAGTIRTGLGFALDFQTNQPVTWYVVAQLDNNFNGWAGDVRVMMDGGNNSFRETYQSSHAGSPLIYAGSIINTPALSETNWMVWTILFNGSSSLIRTNGVSHWTGNPGAQGISMPFLGTDINHGGNEFAGRMSAVLAYGAAHTTAQMQAVEAGLRSRYGF